MHQLRVIVLFLVLVSSAQRLAAQSDSLVVSATLSSFKYVQKEPRKVMSAKNLPLKTRLNPLFYLASSALFVYQRVLSEQLSADCQYTISCSEFTKKSIERFGLLKGTLIGLHQLHHCTGVSVAEYPLHRIGPTGKIINPIE